MTRAEALAVPRWARRLEALGACEEAVEYAKGFPTAAAAWKACERGDWMLWWIGRVAGPPGSEGRRPLVLAACECARLSLPGYEKRHLNDDRPRKAIETAEAWARGGEGTPSLEAVRRAAYAAAYAAADAAYAACAAADAAYASRAAAAAAAAADDAAAYERARVLRKCADIVRKHYPKPPQGGASC